MDFLTDPVFWSRFQFGLTTSFHICWSSMSVGTAVFLVIMEAAWLKTGNDDYYRHTKFWGKLFLLIFAIGVVSGIPLSVQFGTNWEKFSAATGGFFGHLLGFEAAMAFMLESAFLGIMLLGWNRVSKPVHFFSTVMVLFGASLSVFWIMVANSWMQTPAGVTFENNRIVVNDYLAAIFNPDWFLGFSHMWVACLEASLFVIGGISAWKILNGRGVALFRKSFMIAAGLAIVIAPLQFLLGDASGRMIAKHQPAKLAATESHWETNPAGEPAAWNAIAWPDRENQKNAFQIQIPYGLSLIITRSFTGQVKGLSEFPKDEQPPILIPFYAFRIMMGIGFGLIALALVTIWLWFKGRLRTDKIAEQKKVLFLWVCTVPLGYIAIVTGWMTREVGRQPWTVYGLLRTKASATPLPLGAVGSTVFMYTAIYTVLFLLFIYLAAKVLAGDPAADTVPSISPKEAGHGSK